MVWGDKFLFDACFGKQTRYRLEDKDEMELARARAMMAPGAMPHRALAPTAYPLSPMMANPMMAGPMMADPMMAGPMMAGRFQSMCACGAVPKPWEHHRNCPHAPRRCNGRHGRHGGRRRRSPRRFDDRRYRGGRRRHAYDDDSEYGDSDNEIYSDGSFDEFDTGSLGGRSRYRYRPGYYPGMEPHHRQHAGMRYQGDPRDMRGHHGRGMYGGDPYAAHDYRDEDSGYGDSHGSTW
ncbi:MAG: hypothetical protein Q9176_000327 [Flavoplaca citrina]